MARRTRTSEEKENSRAVLRKVKSEKMEKEIKQEQLSKGKAKALFKDDEDDDEQGDLADGNHDVNGIDDDDDDEPGSPKGRKRVRMDEDGESYVVKQEEEYKPRTRAITLPRDDDGYIPGSIVRIQLQNFVTYDWVEFRPGPYLNMILGPNGTGKSSIACAICLGLNWSPSVLGRASELGSFVKMGASQGYIEIELKGPKGQGNLKVRRLLKANSKGSSFTLNGANTTGKEVTKRMAELNVQVGNLCSFLPQDKVCEFAQMNSCQLLRETQRAAGDERLTKWHDTLIKSGKDLKELQDLLVGERNQLKTMQDRNAALERDVIRYKERKRIEHEISVLEILLPVQTYREARDKYFNSKETRDKLRHRVTKLKARNAPAHALKEELEKKHAEYSKSRDAKKNAAQAKFKKTGAKHKESEKLEESGEQLNEQLLALKNKERDAIRRIRSLKMSIQTCESELENPPQTEDPEQLKAEARPLKQAEIKLRMDLDALRVRQASNAEACGKENAVINASMQNIQALDDVNVRKLTSLGNWNRDCHDAIVWLRSNRHRFRLEVFEPPIITVNVNDHQYAAAVEACFNVNQLTTLIAQCQEDLDTLNRVFVDTPEALGRKARLNTWYRAKDEKLLVPSPISREELKAIGFGGYAIDYVGCPDGVLWFLKMEVKLHRTAVTLDTRVSVNQATEAVSRGSTGGANFVIGGTMNQVSRSKYGARATQNVTREIRPARNLVGPTVDVQAKRKLDSAIAEARGRLAILEQEQRKLGEEEAKFRAEGEGIKGKLNDLNKRRQAITDADKQRIRTQTKLDNAKDELRKKMEEPDIEVQRVKLKKEIYDLSMKRLQLAKEHSKLIRETIRDLYQATNVGLQFLQVEASRKALEELCKQKDEKYSIAVTKFNEAFEVHKKLKEESKQALKVSRAKIEAVSDELRREYDRIESARVQYDDDLKVAVQNGTFPPEKTGVELRDSETLQVDLDAAIHNLELHLNTNPGVVEQYEARKRDIETISTKIINREKEMNTLEKTIKVAKNNWQPALQKLVDSIGQKFSAAFDRIRCAGEIKIKEDEDYDKWALDILVKFRDTEKLQLLTGQRQSGGERALTTILYLMSLTEEARAPFSLVDEINQGMDHIAERNVHNSMVEVTCKPDSGQYFLITPKLLPDLQYHERMKILCVNNGEWLPEERQGNLMGMIDSYVQRRESA